MSLTDLPIELFVPHILPHCAWIDVLALCHTNRAYNALLQQSWEQLFNRCYAESPFSTLRQWCWSGLLIDQLASIASLFTTPRNPYIESPILKLSALYLLETKDKTAQQVAQLFYDQITTQRTIRMHAHRVDMETDMRQTRFEPMERLIDYCNTVDSPDRQKLLDLFLLAINHSFREYANYFANLLVRKIPFSIVQLFLSDGFYADATTTNPSYSELRLYRITIYSALVTVRHPSMTSVEILTLLIKGWETNDYDYDHTHYDMAYIYRSANLQQERTIEELLPSLTNDLHTIDRFQERIRDDYGTLMHHLKTGDVLASEFPLKYAHRFISHDTLVNLLERRSMNKKRRSSLIKDAECNARQDGYTVWEYGGTAG